jgi:hypothetical protein
MGRKRKVVEPVLPGMGETDELPSEVPSQTVEPTQQTAIYHSYPPEDGPRFVAGLQDVKERNLYKDFHDGTKLEDVKNVAIVEAREEGRESIVFDRKIGMVVAKYDKTGKLIVPEEKK